MFLVNRTEHATTRIPPYVRLSSLTRAASHTISGAGYTYSERMCYRRQHWMSVGTICFMICAHRSGSSCTVGSVQERPARPSCALQKAMFTGESLIDTSTFHARLAHIEEHACLINTVFAVAFKLSISNVWCCRSANKESGGRPLHP
jgi:hypothetical protein